MVGVGAAVVGAGVSAGVVGEVWAASSELPDESELLEFDGDEEPVRGAQFVYTCHGTECRASQ